VFNGYNKIVRKSYQKRIWLFDIYQQNDYKRFVLILIKLSQSDILIVEIIMGKEEK